MTIEELEKIIKLKKEEAKWLQELGEREAEKRKRKGVALSQNLRVKTAKTVPLVGDDDGESEEE
jgi:hypothetical protein